MIGDCRIGHSNKFYLYFTLYHLKLFQIISSLAKLQPPVPNLDTVLGIAFDHLAQKNLEIRRTCANLLALLYYPNSSGGCWVNSTHQRRHYIFVNELIGDLNNHFYMFMILEKFKVVPYYAFYGSLYASALIQPIEQGQYASQAYFNVILRYIPKNKIHCVGTFHRGFIGETDFDWIVRINPFDS